MAPAAPQDYLELTEVCQNCAAPISVPGQLPAQGDGWEALPVIIEPGVQ